MEVLACIGVIAIMAGLVFGGWKAYSWVSDVNDKLHRVKMWDDTIFELRSDMKKTHNALSDLVALTELQQPSMLDYISQENRENETLNFCQIMYDELNQFYPEDRYTSSRSTNICRRVHAMKNEEL